MVLVSDLVGSANGFEPLSALTVDAVVHVDGFSTVENETVSLVHGSSFRFNQSHADVPLPLHLVQFLRAVWSVGVNVVEPTFDPARQVPYPCKIISQSFRKYPCMLGRYRRCHTTCT